MRGPDRSEVVVHGDAGGLAVRTIRNVVEGVLDGERHQARIDIVFMGKERMRQLNVKCFRHNYPTDVISFPLPQPGGGLVGEICICRYVAARNAREHVAPVREELFRLLVHGTLHVLGYDHPEGAGRTRSPMWQRQERYLARIA